MGPGLELTRRAIEDLGFSERDALIRKFAMAMNLTAEAAVGAYSLAEQVRVPQDLEHRSLYITVDGATWVDAPRLEELAPSLLVKLYTDMCITRAVDAEVVRSLRKALAFGKLLVSTGNEATAVGAAAAARPTDWLTMAIRDMGAYITRGVAVDRILAQAMGREMGLTRGWDGAGHMGSRSHRIVGLVSHLGTLIPVASGLAFAAKYAGTDDAVVAFSGDGATSTGDFYEALNIACVQQLPLVVVIENNRWAFGTPNRLQFAVPTLALRALGFGRRVEGCWVDGTNVVTVYETVRRALERARREHVITIVETASMRLEGHSLADPFGSYVPQEEVAFWKERDPLPVFQRRLLEAGIVTKQQFEEIDRTVAQDVLDAALRAESSPPAKDPDIRSKVFSAPTTAYAATPEAPDAGAHITYHQAIREALQEEMDRNENIFLIGEDIGVSNGAFKITEGFAKRYDKYDWNDYAKTDRPLPQRRVIDAPLAEAGFTGLALGAQLAGLTPVVEFQYADFSSEAFKMLVNYAATETVRGMGPVSAVFRMPSGWAANTSIYHSVNPESWYSSTPGLKIVAPATAFDAKGLLKAAIHDNNPVLFLEYKTLYRLKPDKIPPELNLAIPDGDYVVPIGKGRIVTTGTDLSVISYGSQVWRALEAAQLVEKEDGVRIEVIDLRSIVPFDRALIQASVHKTSRALVTCEAPETGCFGATIVTEIMRTSFDDLDAPVRLVAAADTPVPFAPGLEAEHLPTVDKLVRAIREVLAA
jgi:2-oxoisovalerate dehydrogenase E1 component